MASTADAAREDLRPFLVRTVIVVGVALAAIVLVGGLILLADIALLTFGAILVATTLRHGGAWISRWTPLSRFWGFVALTVTILLAFVLLAVFAGPAIVRQVQEFVPDFLEQLGYLRARVEQVSWAKPLVEKIASGNIQATRILSGGFVSGAIGSIFSTAQGLLVAALVVFGAGIFMGFDPQAYREPVVRLFPPNRRPRIRQTLDDTGLILARWFVGRLATMIFNGGCVAILLWFLDVPMPWLLGLITGLFTFVPLLGSWLAIVPAVIFAAPQGIDSMIIIVVAYTITQQIENIIVEPLVMLHAIKMPPAYVLLSQLALGALTGAVGVAFAVPFLAAVAVIVQRLYVEDILGDTNADEDDDGDPGPGQWSRNLHRWRWGQAVHAQRIADERNQ